MQKYSPEMNAAIAQSAPHVARPWCDPRNPDALGYDRDAPEYRAAWAEATARGTETANALQGLLDRETARFKMWVHRYERGASGGVGWSGFDIGGGDSGFKPTDIAWLLDHAKKLVAQRAAWKNSPDGRLCGGLNEMERRIGELLTLTSETQSARSRQDGSVEAKADALQAAVKELQVLASDIAIEAMAAAMLLAKPEGES